MKSFTPNNLDKINKVYDSIHRLNIRNVLFSSASDQDLVKLIEVDEKRRKRKPKASI